MKRTASALITTALLTLGLSACSSGSSGPTFDDAKSDHSKAEQACQNAFGDDADKLKKLVPADTEPTAKYRVTGEWDDKNLMCSIRSQSEHTDVTFSTEDVSGGMGLTSHQGSLYASAGAESFPSEAQGVLDDATKALAG